MSRDLEQAIVDLLDEGWARWKIAEKIGLGESTVREVIRRMCARYECSMRDLPDVYRKENAGVPSTIRRQDDEEEPARDPYAGAGDPERTEELDARRASQEEA